MNKPEDKEPGTAIVSWKEKMNAVVAQSAAMEAPTGGFLSFKGGRMSYDDTPIPGDKMEVIMIDFLLENTWYLEDYNALKPAVPTCYALGRDEATLAPHEECDDPQNTQCGISGQEGCCQYAEWGSDRKGGRGKDCKNTRRIAMIAADVLKADDPIAAIKKAGVVMCKIPVTSIKIFSKTINQITKVLGVPQFAVVIELSVTPHPANQFQINWKIMDQIQDQELLEALYNKYVGNEKVLFAPYPKMEEESAPKNKKY